jgi:hypothetical protein
VRGDIHAAPIINQIKIELCSRKLMSLGIEILYGSVLFLYLWYLQQQFLGLRSDSSEP